MSLRDKLLDGLNWVLVANIFFVFLSFAWFAIATVGRSAHVNLGLDLWYALWTPLFQPALGLLMAGAILSGVASWVKRKFAAE